MCPFAFQIALLLIKHFSEEPIQTGKHIVFLVPSVALAVQHYSTISANTPYKIGLVHGGQPLQHEESRVQLTKCDMYVFTFISFIFQCIQNQLLTTLSPFPLQFNYDSRRVFRLAPSLRRLAFGPELEPFSFGRVSQLHG